MNFNSGAFASAALASVSARAVPEVDYAFSVHIVATTSGVSPQSVLVVRRRPVDHLATGAGWEALPLADFDSDHIKLLIDRYDPCHQARRPVTDLEHRDLLERYKLDMD